MPLPLISLECFVQRACCVRMLCFFHPLGCSGAPAWRLRRACPEMHRRLLSITTLPVVARWRCEHKDCCGARAQDCFGKMAL